MSSKISRCSHVTIIGGNTWEDIYRKKAKQESCETCDCQVANLWLCLYDGCLYVGCGEAYQDHSSLHADKTSHCLTLNTTTMRIWCYECEAEVYKEANIPPIDLRTGSKSSNNQYTSRSYDDSEESEEDDLHRRPRGLTGLYNIGNTCYMNAALQCLSNCPPLVRFFLDCDGFIPSSHRPTLSKSYRKLITEMWHFKRPSYVTPTEISQGIKQLHPMFKGYTQQDAQEFLRCFMDDLHEELKMTSTSCLKEVNGCKDDISETQKTENSDNISSSSETCSGYGSSDTVAPLTSSSSSIPLSTTDSGIVRSLSTVVDLTQVSDTEYETCDSGASSEHNLSGTGSEHNLSDAGSTDSSRPFAAHIEPQVHSSAANKHKGHTRSKSSTVNPNNFKRSLKGFTSKQLKDSENQASKHAHKTQSSPSRPSSPASDVDSYSDAISDVDSSNKPSGATATTRSKTAVKRKKPEYKSVISDVFDGKINSSVQCLTCERVSSTRETFQDLSLPIPGKDHLHVLHASQGGVVPSQQAYHSAVAVAAKSHKGACGEVALKQSWFGWMFGWMKSWLMGPTVTLQDCLAAFFSADDLKGDNMYSCEKCKKLRNGVKFSKVLKLPEVLCIHLKRFRHEFMYSSKIGNYVAFPLEGLDMTPYLHKDCEDQVSVYDLVSVICHHGTAGGGHYTSYGLNYVNLQWYEFDDQCVTEVDMQAVENCEAYVLFYRKRNEGMMKLRQRANELMQSPQTSMMQFFISRQWINKFNTFAEPGPINNYDFLCRHGGVAPEKVHSVNRMVIQVSSELWQLLHNKFGGGPAVNHIYHCSTCQQEKDKLLARQKFEKERFTQLYKEFQINGNPAIYAISLLWFKQWEKFIEDKVSDPPGPIDNTKISTVVNGQVTLRHTADYGQISEDTWNFLHSIYTGGPEIVTKPRTQTLLQQQQSLSQPSHNTPAPNHSPTVPQTAAAPPNPHTTTAQTHSPPPANTTKEHSPPEETSTSEESASINTNDCHSEEQQEEYDNETKTDDDDNDDDEDTIKQEITSNVINEKDCIETTKDSEGATETLSPGNFNELERC